MDRQTKDDLWQQFSDEIADPNEKTSATDGSEWAGQFDRRAQSRDAGAVSESTESGDEASNSVNDSNSGNDSTADSGGGSDISSTESGDADRATDQKPGAE